MKHKFKDKNYIIDSESTTKSKNGKTITISSSHSSHIIPNHDNFYKQGVVNHY